MSVATDLAAVPDLGTGRGRVWRRLRHEPLGMVGLALIALVVLAGVVGPFVAPYGPAETHFDAPFQQPGTIGYVLGTDDLGRDILTRTLYGIRVSLQVGLLSVALAVVVGTPLGLVAGYWRRLDGVVSRLTDVALAFPFLILAVGLAAINGPSLGNAVLAIGISHVPGMIRIVRGETLRIAASDFVLSARTMHAGGVRIMAQHVLPNAVSAIVVQATVIMPVAVIGEAVLSFLGLGIRPPTPSLGIMLSDAQQYLQRAPFAAVVPGASIALICLGFNLFGDALRDALDPTAGSRRRGRAR
ncbi:ABC transporter permease [Amnibacterium endophyticum]|uniref:ABC transporter permease n=1 Tax=Amnibacterium endophyticum TaxID=2109337 RepID=A0ABW4LF09_9MICO